MSNSFVLVRYAFALVSLFLVIYFFTVFKHKKRFPILIEINILLFYTFIFLYGFFYNFFINIFKKIGIQNPSILFVYMGVFVIFLILLILYRKTEKQREDITNLVSEIAILKNEKNNKKGKR